LKSKKRKEKKRKEKKKGSKKKKKKIEGKQLCQKYIIPNALLSMPIYISLWELRSASLFPDFEKLGEPLGNLYKSRGEPF